jgi:quercetin dioxygenase-like cupin family protein
MRRSLILLSVVTVIPLVLLVAGWLAVGTLAQEGTPAAEGGEPEDVTFETISAAPAETLPSAPAEVVLLRITIQPGAAVPAPNDPGASFTYVESGTATVRLEAAVGIGRAAQFDTPEEDPFERVAAGTEFPVGPGDAFVIPPLTEGELRNDGQEPVVLLVTYLFPTGEPAMPGTGTPAP